MIKKYKRTLLGLLTGALAGYLYYQFTGCSSGSCPITSSPVNSTLYGLVMGGLIANLFQKTNTQN